MINKYLWRKGWRRKNNYIFLYLPTTNTTKYRAWYFFMLEYFYMVDLKSKKVPFRMKEVPYFYLSKRWKLHFGLLDCALLCPACQLFYLAWNYFQRELKYPPFSFLRIMKLLSKCSTIFGFGFSWGLWKTIYYWLNFYRIFW